MSAGNDKNVMRDFIKEFQGFFNKGIVENKGMFPNSTLPKNLVTGTRYKGANLLKLASENRSNNYWVTENQAITNSGFIKPEEQGKGVTLQYWTYKEYNSNGEEVQLEKPKMSTFTVYNIDQTEGLNYLIRSNEKNLDASEKLINETLNKLGINIVEKPDLKTFIIEKNVIYTPPKENGYREVYLRNVVNKVGTYQALNHYEKELNTKKFITQKDQLEIQLTEGIISGVLCDEFNLPVNNKKFLNVAEYIKNTKDTPATNLNLIKVSNIGEVVLKDTEKLYINLKNQLNNTIEKNINIQDIKQETNQPRLLATERQDIFIPYKELKYARAVGVKWDPVTRKNYVEKGFDLSKVARWANVKKIEVNENDIKQKALEGFTKKMQDMGFEISGEHPIANGSIQRCKIAGDRQGELGGAYFLTPDNKVGYIENHRTKEVHKWNYYNNISISPTDKVILEQSRQPNKINMEAINLKRELASKRCEEIIKELETNKSIGLNDYLKNKKINFENLNSKNIYTNENTTFLPLKNINNVVKSMQIIREDGSKRFIKDSQKTGSFFIVGSDNIDDLKNEKGILISEGFSTAASIYEAVKIPVISVGDANNLKVVAKEIRNKFNDKEIIIFADDDLNLKLDPKINKNIGLDSANEVAKEINGYVITPSFRQEDEQIKNKLTDFNDIVSKTSLGLEGLKNQIEPIVNNILLVKEQSLDMPNNNIDLSDKLWLDNDEIDMPIQEEEIEININDLDKKQNLNRRM